MLRPAAQRFSIALGAAAPRKSGDIGEEVSQSPSSEIDISPEIAQIARETTAEMIAALTGEAGVTDEDVRELFGTGEEDLTEVEVRRGKSEGMGLER